MADDVKPRELIHPAIIAIMRAIGPIAKDQRNEQQKFNFRGIDAVYNACHPHFAEHGVYSTSTIIESQFLQSVSGKGTDVIRAIIKMRYTFWAEDGSNVSTEVVGEGMDYGGDKASNKAMSAADKYAILQLLKIPTAMVDGDRGPNAAPAANNAAPRVAPRSERADTKVIAAAKTEWASWRTANQLSVSPEEFALWCDDCGVIEKKIANDAASWTPAIVAKFRIALDHSKAH